jgi:RHS repeat-associated protein
MSGTGASGTPITRDPLGRILNMVESTNGTTHSWTYTYDVRGRLESVTEDGGLTTYGYDPNGNLTDINGETFGTYDAQDRLVTFAPPEGGISWGLTYTNNGDLLDKGNGTLGYQFGYDLSSNLRYVQLTGGVASGVDYLIDGANRRIGRAVTSSGTTVMDGLLYDEQGRVVAELDGSNNVLSTFVYGLKGNVPDYMVRGGVTYRIVSDWRGSVRLVLNTTETGSAAVVQQLDYDEWGNVTGLVDPICTQGGTTLCLQPFGFAGGVFDVTTGVARFGARDYDSQMRRWTQKDPIRMGGGINVYKYSGDDPINRADPTGLDGPDGGVLDGGASDGGLLPGGLGSSPDDGEPSGAPGATPNPGKNITCLAVGGAVYIGCTLLKGSKELCTNLANAAYNKCLGQPPQPPNMCPSGPDWSP